MSYSSFFCLVQELARMWGAAVSLCLSLGKMSCLTVGCTWATTMMWVWWRSPEYCVEMLSRCICLAFPSRAPGALVHFVSFYLKFAWLILRDVGVISDRCVLFGTCLNHSWRRIMAENELLLPIQNLAFLCKRCIPSSIPGLWSATIQLSFPWVVDSEKKY